MNCFLMNEPRLIGTSVYVNRSIAVSGVHAKSPQQHEQTAVTQPRY